MHRRRSLLFPRACHLVLLVGMFLSHAALAGPPNIVLIIGDDHAWDASGFMGHELVETPELDALASGGTVFTQGQNVTSICRPSLLTIVSGLHPNAWEAKRLALSSEREIGYREEIEWIRTLPRELDRRGYRSWEGGKWWDGSFEQGGFDAGLEPRTPGEQDGRPIHSLARAGWDSERCGFTRTSDEACPALDPVRAFLDTLDEEAEEPFFLWFAPKLPHSPYDPPEEFVLPYLVPGLTIEEILYFAQVTRLDAAIGELLRLLSERELLEETLIVYVSDNGYEIGQGVFRNPGKGKGSLHELGTRTPIIFHWPGRVPAGVVRDDLVSTEDLYPTLLDYAGLVPSQDRPGSSLRPAIERGEAFDRQAMVSAFGGNGDENRGFFVRTDTWRYISSEDGREALFDVRSDPYERDDVAAEHPDVIAWAREVVLDWASSVQLAPEAHEVIGQLVDPSGAPRAGAALRMRGDGVDVRVRADAEGWFRFAGLPTGSYALESAPWEPALAPLPPISVPSGPTGRMLGPVEIDAGASPRWSGPAGRSTLHGSVLGRDGAAVRNAHVRVRRLDARRRDGWRVRSDGTGRYLVEGLAPGLHVVTARPPGERRGVERLVWVGDEPVERTLRLGRTRRGRHPVAWSWARWWASFIDASTLRRSKGSL